MAKHAGHDERRSAFAAAAFRALAREGIAGLTVRNVAREAGFTTGALVHYYPSKNQLFLAASEHAAYVVRPRMEQDEVAYGGLEGLRRVIYDALPTTAEARDLWSVWLVFWDRAKTDPVIGALAQERYSEWHGRLERLIRRAQDDGLIAQTADAGLLAQMAIVLVDGIAIQTLRTSARLSAKRQRAMIDTWIANLPAPKRRPQA
ncbi:MAG: TetR family transcriptional regulator [Alphaproteobacteria bacterium]|nr:TetR family transcriptional regulator [Alphaproteobacteria bacterium]